MRRSKNRRDLITSSPIASRGLLGSLHRSPALTALGEWADRRLYHPEGRNRAPATIGTRVANASRIIMAKPSPVRKVSRLTFQTPKKVAVCVRREQRREVLMALGKAGGGRSRRKPKRNHLSEISCRRK